METNQRIRQIIKSQTAPYPPQGVLWIHELEGKEVKEVWKNGQWAPIETISLEEIWDILNNSAGDKGVKPIVITSVLSSGMTMNELAEIGLTKNEIIAAARGERNCVSLQDEYGYSQYPITTAYYLPENTSLGIQESFSFQCVYTHYDGNGQLDGTAGFEIVFSDGVLEVTEI